MTTTTRKMQAIKDLTAQHFITWIKKQVRLNGRHGVIGFIGDHINNPLENWLQELTGERYIPVMIEGFEVAGVEYALSHKFQAVSMAFEGDLDADPVLAEQGWREITAWGTLQMVEQLVSPDDRLTMQPVSEQVEDVVASAKTSTEKRSTSTIVVEGISSSLIKCVARKTFTVGGVTVKAGEQFFLVQSSSDASRYYVVAIIAGSWTCSCGAASKSHAHKNVVKAWILEHVVKPRQAAAVAGDKSYDQALGTKLDSFYQARGADIEAAGTLNRQRKVVAPTGPSSTEKDMAARGWMAR